MPAYRFDIPAVGLGDTPDEAFAFVLNNLEKNAQVTIDREIEYAEIKDEEELQHALHRLLSLHEPASL